MPTLRMRIRKAQVDDIPAIQTLIRDVSGSFLPKAAGKHAAAFFKTISDEAMRGYITGKDFDYLVAEQDSQLAGVLAIKECRHIYHLFVAERYWRRGVASALWREAKRKALAGGNPGWFTLNATPYAVAVYERFGFRATGEKVYKYGIDFVPMRLEIESNLDAET